MVQTWSRLYWFRHQHGSGGCLFLLDPPIVVDGWAGLLHSVLLVVDVAEVGLLIVAQSTWLACRIAANPPDMVECALIRADSQAAGRWLDRILNVISLNRARSLLFKPFKALWT